MTHRIPFLLGCFFATTGALAQPVDHAAGCVTWQVPVPPLEYLIRAEHKRTLPDPLRDAQGRLIFNVLFYLAPEVAAETGDERATLRALAKAVDDANRIFAAQTTIRLRLAGYRVREELRARDMDQASAAILGNPLTTDGFDFRRLNWQTIELDQAHSAHVSIAVVPYRAGQPAGAATSARTRRYLGFPWFFLPYNALVAITYDRNRGDSPLGIGGVLIAHELGHFFGLAHGLETDRPVDQAQYREFLFRPYAMGYIQPRANANGIFYSDVMSYLQTGLSQQQLRVFSSPSHTAGEQPLGVVDRADGARLLREDALDVQRNMANAPRDAVVYGYYNYDLDHYFITAGPIEANGIDAYAAGPGWVRTGEWWRAAVNPNVGAPVCRFYGDPTAGPNSHFYTANTAECEWLKQLDRETPRGRSAWRYEGIAFNASVPVGQSCGAGSFPIYRLYNNGANRRIASNHRFTPTRGVYDAMQTKGWIGEGVAFCGYAVDVTLHELNCADLGVSCQP